MNRQRMSSGSVNSPRIRLRDLEGCKSIPLLISSTEFPPAQDGWLIGLKLLPILHWNTESWSFLTVRSRPWSNGRSISCHMGVLRIGAGSSVGWQWGQVVVVEHVVGVGVPLLAQTSVWHAAQATAHWTEKEQKKIKIYFCKSTATYKAVAQW